MWTTSGAKVLRWEEMGSLQPGKNADLIIIDRNPITCDLDPQHLAYLVNNLYNGHELAINLVEGSGGSFSTCSDFRLYYHEGVADSA